LNDVATDIMQELAIRFFDNRCFVTHEKFRRRGFVLHHLWYIDDDVIRSNYPKGEKGRQMYIKALKPKVEDMPFRFMLIKNGVHTRLDHIRTGLTRMKKENFMRLCVAVLLTKKTKRKNNKRRYVRHKK
jgi:hypothetical protein|tara:strand:+ start:473 stop:859 length:387 start_codon:yes stop_codon:yes gene_type:complete